VRKNYLVFGLSILLMLVIVPFVVAQETTEAPDTAAPVVKTPAAEKPVVETPAAEKPAVETPAAEKPKQMEAPILTVETIACGTAIEDRELQGQDTTFAKGTEKIYCWNLITGGENPTTVEHVWYLGGEEMARVTLDIKYPRVRTWSSKTILPEWTGDWKVEVVDSAGKVIGSTAFKVE
jgi:hypothetical protein